MAFIGTALALDYWGSQELPRGALLAALIVGTGLGAMFVPPYLHHFLFGPTPQPRRWQANLPPRRTFVLHLSGWQEVPGSSPRTWQAPGEGAGELQVSFQPLPDRPAGAAPETEKELAEQLRFLGQTLQLGEQTSLTSSDTATGKMAYADYQSEKHGRMRFWLLPTREIAIFASYTEDRSPEAAGHIAEAHLALKDARFE